MSGQWTKLTVTVKNERCDDAVAIMSMLENGLMIEDFSDFSLNGMYGELVDDTILNADKTIAKISLFVPEERNVSEYTSFITTRFALEKIDFSLECEGLDEEDWAHAWKKYYKPVHLGKVTVVPAWEEYTPTAGEVILRMDPGMAFGTGTHETTRLVIRLMQDEEIAGKRVLDVGTGSGILSIAASKLGAGSVCAYDIDPVAARVARENARDNGCDNITVGVSDLLRDVDTSGGKYGVCLANIVADIIIRMLPDLGSYLEVGAPVILSGIIGEREAEVTLAAEKYGYRVLRRETENDWVGLLIKKA